MSVITNFTPYVNGDVVTCDMINDTIETAINANKLTQTPDCTDANNVGTPNVTVTSDGRLKFSNLKGEKGDIGPQGIQGPQGIAGQGGNLSAANANATKTTKIYGMKPVAVPAGAGDPLTSNLVEIPIYSSTTKLNKDYISGLPYLVSATGKPAGCNLYSSTTKTVALSSLVDTTPSVYSKDVTLRKVSCAANNGGIGFTVTGPDYYGNCEITFRLIKVTTATSWVVSIYITDIFNNTKTAYINVTYNPNGPTPNGSTIKEG